MKNEPLGCTGPVQVVRVSLYCHSYNYVEIGLQSRLMLLSVLRLNTNIRHLNSIFFNSRQAERLQDHVFSEEKLSIKHRKPEVALSINVGVFR